MRIFMLGLMLVGTASNAQGIAGNAHESLESLTEPQEVRLSPKPCARAQQQLDPNIWSMYRVQKIRVMSQVWTLSNPDPVGYPYSFAARDLNPEDAGANLVTNGVFSAWDKKAKIDKPMGLVMRHGKADNSVDSNSREFYRAGVAVLTDGSSFICNPGLEAARALGRGPTLKSPIVLNEKTINTYCSKHGVGVRDFMGGAATLVNAGQKVCGGDDVPPPCDKSLDVVSVQKFIPDPARPTHPFSISGPKRIDQFRPAQHMIFAQKHGELFVIWPGSNNSKIYYKNFIQKSAKQIQDELCLAGYDQVIKYDGGGGFMAITPDLAKAQTTGSAVFGFVMKARPVR